jgi:hypothetical protein
VIATDGSNFAQETFNWTIASPVTLSAIADQTTTEGTTISTLGQTASDASAGTMKFTAIGLPAGLAINASNGNITGTLAPGAAADGPYSVTVIANDGAYSASQSFAWNTNSPITLTASAEQANNEGDGVSVSTSSADASMGTVTYSAIGLPQGLKINTSTGAITGTVAVGDSTAGSYNFTLVASDGIYNTVQSVNWTVNDPITTLAIAAQSQNAANSVSLQVESQYSGVGTLVYFANTLPAGLTINSANGLISGRLTSPIDGNTSSTITTTDGTYTSVTTISWTVQGDPGLSYFVYHSLLGLQPAQVTAPKSGKYLLVTPSLDAGQKDTPNNALMSQVEAINGTFKIKWQSGAYQGHFAFKDAKPFQFGKCLYVKGFDNIYLGLQYVGDLPTNSKDGTAYYLKAPPGSELNFQTVTWVNYQLQVDGKIINNESLAPATYLEAQANLTKQIKANPDWAVDPKTVLKKVLAAAKVGVKEDIITAASDEYVTKIQGWKAYNYVVYGINGKGVTIAYRLYSTIDAGELVCQLEEEPKLKPIIEKK